MGESYILAGALILAKVKGSVKGMSTDEVKCVPLASEHADAAAEIITRQFCGAGEPLFHGCGVSYDDIHAFILLLCERSAKQGLSTVCLINGEVAAAFVSQDLKARLVTEGDAYLSTPDGVAGIAKLAPSMELVKRLHHKLFADHPELADDKQGVLFHQVLVAVSNKFTRRGLCNKIFAANLQQAAAQGFTTAIVECSGSFSLAAALKAGYVEHNRIVYADFEYNGTKPFSSVERDTGHTACVLCIRDLK